MLVVCLCGRLMYPGKKDVCNLSRLNVKKKIREWETGRGDGDPYVEH